MLPILLQFQVAGLRVRLGAYAFLIFCGALAALLIVLGRAKEARLSSRALLPVLTLGVLGGFLGARLGAFLQTGGGGFVLYAGFIAAFLTGLIAARGRGLPALDVADLAVPCALLAAAFGRVGCLLAGCCYGVVRDGGLSYPSGSHAFRQQVRQGLLDPRAPESLPTVPIALYEAAALLLLFIVTSALWRRRLRPGSVLGVAGILYGGWRFVAEFWRADNASYWPGGLTFSQGISLAVLATCIAILRRSARAAAACPPPTFDLRPASALQGLLLLFSVALSLGGISCASHAGSPTHSTSGTHVYRKTPAGNDASGPNQKEDSGGWLGDCINDCVSDCTSDCINSCSEALCENACSDEESAGAEDPATPRHSLNSALGMLQPGKKYRGSIKIEAVVSKQFAVLLTLEGTLSAAREAPDGTRRVKLRLRNLDLVVGEVRWSGSGDVDLEVGADADVRILQSTLPSEVLTALASLDGLCGNLLQGAPSERPLEDLRKVVQEELAAPEVRAGFSMVATFEGRERWTVGEGRVLQNPPGTYTLFWKVGY